MPKMDGEELLKKLRKKTTLPVIFLTSKDDEIDELLGLKLGADDFVKKSGGFSIKVLIERIRVQLRKKNLNPIEETKNIISHGKLKLDPSQLECEWDGKQLPDKLTTTEFLIVQELLASFQANQNPLVQSYERQLLIYIHISNIVNQYPLRNNLFPKLKYFYL